MKLKTREQVERMKQKAVRFVENVLEDEEHAADLEDESLEAYANRKHIKIVENPQTRTYAPMETKAELTELLDQAAEKVGELLNPVLTREQIVEGLQELDEMLNGSDDESDEDESDEDDE